MHRVLLCSLTEAQVDLLGYYEDVIYERVQVNVETEEQGSVTALVYRWKASSQLLGEEWDPNVHFLRFLTP